MSALLATQLLLHYAAANETTVFLFREKIFETLKIVLVEMNGYWKHLGNI